MVNRFVFMKVFGLFFLAIFQNLLVLAQPKKNTPIPWVPLREGDVSSHWVVDRIIDTRLKINKPLEGPGIPLWKLIETAINNQNLKVYTHDSLTQLMTYQDIKKKTTYEYVIQIQSSPNEPFDVKDSVITESIDWSNIKKFMIREHILFNKAEGRMFYRIEWIAPMYQPYIPGIKNVKEQPLCFIRYYDPNGLDTACFRNEAMMFKVFNPALQSKALTFDDYFEMRMFEGHVVKENNTFGYALKDFEALKDDPVWQMLHGQEIKDDKHRQEIDQWEH